MSDIFILTFDVKEPNTMDIKFCKLTDLLHTENVCLRRMYWNMPRADTDINTFNHK